MSIVPQAPSVGALRHAVKQAGNHNQKRESSQTGSVLPKNADAPAQSAVYPPGVDEYLGILAGKDSLRRLHRSVLRTASIDARELQAAHATQRSLTWVSLRDALLRFCSDGVLDGRVDDILRRLPSLPLMTFARVVALQNLRPSDRRVALALYGRLLTHHGARAFRKPHGKLLADLAFQFGDRTLLRRVLREFRLDPLEQAALTADLLNPSRDQLQDEGEWVAVVNACLGEEVAPVVLRPAKCSAFDRLDTVQVPQVEEGPKVTIAITTWHPDDGFVTAFRSIACQSWRNIEILVVDDHSPADFEPLLQAVVATDSRARLVRMPRNGGTYLARNRALDEATGDLFTVHDSDDWAHPQRIERQVRRLMACQDLVSTTSRALRADDDLIFNLSGVSPSRENASSLMFRRREVMAAIGYYDQSRKGADTEYALRMARHFGEGSHELLDCHLAFIRLSSGSLSREEFRPGWRHPSRLAYRLGYQWDHAHKAAAGLSLYVGRDGEGAGFSRPVRFLVDRDSDEVRRRQSWDVVYVLDLRETAEQPPTYLDELLALVQAGRRVAVLHMESMLYPLIEEVEPYDAEMQRLISTGVVGEVLATDEAEVANVVVREPSVLQFAASTKLPLKAERVLVVPDGLPRTRGESGWTYSIADVEDHAFRVFGKEATWVLDDVQQAACSTPSNSPRHTLPRSWGPVTGSPVRWRAPRPALAGEWPRLGRVVLDETDARWVNGSLTTASLGADCQVSLFVAPDIAGELNTLRRRKGWRVEAGSRPPDTYFALIDVLLLHGSDPRSERHVRHAIEAAASGCVLLGDDAWFDMPGQELLRCQLEEVQGACARIRASAELEQDYRLASCGWATQRMDPGNFVEAVSPS